MRRQIPADERKNHSSPFRSDVVLVILASPRKEFATARASAVIFFLPFLFSQKERGVNRPVKCYLTCYVTKYSQLNRHFDFRPFHNLPVDDSFIPTELEPRKFLERVGNFLVAFRRRISFHTERLGKNVIYQQFHE